MYCSRSGCGVTSRLVRMRGSMSSGRRFLAGLERAHRFQQRLLEGAADGHHFADRLHLRTERFVCARKLLKLPLRNLDDHVIERRLKARRRLARDVVGNLVERVADGELGRDLRDRKSRRLRRQRRRTRHARVHLDDDHASVVRIDGELNVRSAGLDADLADDGDRGIAHRLVFAVGERLRRRDGDRVAGVRAHRIEVLDGADDDDVVGEIAHQLELVLFPAEHRFFEQHFVNRREIEAAGEQFQQLFAVVGNAAAGSARA